METVHEIDNQTHYKMSQLVSQIHSTLVILQTYTEDKSINDSDIEIINNIISIMTENSDKLRQIIHSFKTKIVQ